MKNEDSSLKKSERLSSGKVIDRLFNGSGSRSISVFPLRLVFMTGTRGDREPPAQMMISVPKRHLKLAIDRNRVKRQVREAYRHNKYLLADIAGKKLVMAFIYMDNRLHDGNYITARVRRLIERVSERQLKN